MKKIKKILCVILVSFLCDIKVSAKIEDALYITIDDIAITKLDVVNEIKIILILSNTSYSVEKKDMLNDMAIKSIIRRSVKNVEIRKNDFLKYNPIDLENELLKLANNLNVDVDTLKSICESNGLEFSLILDQIKTQLLWNSLIFTIYKDNLKISAEEIADQLKLLQEQKDVTEYLVSEILIKYTSSANIDIQTDDLINEIKTEGFENVAMTSSISESNTKGGDLGWLNEDIISEKVKKKIENTQIGNISEPIILPEGILIFKIGDKRTKQREIHVEEEKNRLVNIEKQKILNMYSISHYDKLRRSVAIKFYED